LSVRIRGGLMNKDMISSALFDMYDIRNVLSAKIKNKPKDNDGTIFTVGDCIDSVIEFLEDLERGEA
jgi:hypothetical protein